MKKTILLLFTCCLIAALSACGKTTSADNNTEQTTPTESAEAETVQEESETESADAGQTETTEGGKALVAYFAYNENMGDTSGMSVDAISSASLSNDAGNESGNLQVMAQVIQEQTGADIFQILVSEPYDPEYEVMRERAYEELDNSTVPELQATVDNLDDYDVIYIGTPVWSGSMPRPVASFLNENDLSGKTIVPIGIHLGSGFGSILREMEELAPNAVIADGFTINAGTDNDEVRGTSNHETGRKYSDKESLLYGREKDHGQGADAPFRRLSAAEGICVHQFLEQCKLHGRLRPRLY